MTNPEQNQFNGFICPVSGEPLTFDDGSLVSPSGAIYPVVDGIPILVTGNEHHLQRIEQLKSSPKAAWYLKPQVDYYDHGPYRHALARRRKIVREWVRFCCTELLRNDPARTLNVLDLGCGDGASTRWVDSALPEGRNMLQMTDYNFERIARARELLGTDGKRYFLSRVTGSPLPAGSVDLVFTNHVIEHVPDDQGFLKEIHRLLVPGGYLLLGCPTEGVFFWMLAYALSPGTIRKSDHIHFYNRRDLERMGREAGLKHLRSLPVGYGIPHWQLDSLLRRFKPVDDAFHLLGRMLVPSQATSIYLLFRKNPAQA